MLASRGRPDDFCSKRGSSPRSHRDRRRLVALAVLLAASACGGGGAGPDAGEDADAEGEGRDAAPDAPALDAGAGDADGDAAVDADGPGPCDPAALDVVGRGDLVVGGEPVAALLSRCSEDRWGVVAAAGTRLAVEVTQGGLYSLLVAVSLPDAPSFAERIAVARTWGFGEAARIVFEVPRSGELVLLVRPDVPEVSEGYGIAVSCEAACDLETTRYPVVLVHGWTGFESIGPIDYFYGIPDLLHGEGYPVFVAVLDPYNSVEVRSEQLASEVDRFLVAGRATKVSLIAHSQGGLDARRLISTLGYGDRVSALVTVATPHQGTPITDIALGLMPGESEAALYFLLDLLGAEAAGTESDAEASFYSLSEEYVRGELNPATPDDPRVSYVSYAGRTCLYGLTCDDVCDVEIRWAYDLIYLAAGPNDGMVPLSSAPWGDYRGEIPADHFDEVGQLFGVTGPAFDHEAFYLGLARDLAADGH